MQLNFDRYHNDGYRKLIKPQGNNHPFVVANHPVKANKDFTMSWARIDIDLDAGEVLIEELQTDWLRDALTAAKWGYKRLKRQKVKDRDRPNVFNMTSLNSYIAYYEQYLSEYINVWQEATLNLAIRFAVNELGCKRIFYNTFNTGNFMKGLDDYYPRPPKSLYTRLPGRFGFKKTVEIPILLRKDAALKKKLRTEGLEWYFLTF